MPPAKTYKASVIAALKASCAAIFIATASPALASLDDQFLCDRAGETEAIVIPSSRDRTKASVQFAGDLHTIPTIDLVLHETVGDGAALYSAVADGSKEHGTRFVLTGTMGKLFFGDFFANCVVNVGADGQDRQEPLMMPLIELDREGLNLIINEQPDSRKKFGLSRLGMLAFVSRLLGTPTQTTGSQECSIAPDAAMYAPLTLYFKDDIWIGWSLHQGDRDPETSVQVQTSEGLKIGSENTWALSETERLKDSTLGIEYFSDGISYVVDGEPASVRHAWSGELCVFR